MDNAKNLEEVTMRRVMWHMMPYFMATYLVAVLDRVNIGFGALYMNRDIGLTQTMFGIGGGVFFITYCVLEVPSNLMLQRYSARRWLAMIMIGWGLVSAAMALVQGPITFVTMRFLLGAAEAGFFPGVVLYMTYWFPGAYRARAVGFLFAAVPIAGVIGSPISGALLNLEGVLGLHGWQMLYVIESLPAILLGVFALFWLTGSPAEAKWLKPEQREWLAERIKQEANSSRHAGHMTLWQVLRNPVVLTFALVLAASGMPSMMMPIWQPTIFKEFGLTNFQNGLINAIPNAVAVVAMIWCARNSDRTGERVWHNFIPLMMIVAGLLGLLVLRDLWSAVVLISMVIAGTYACKGPFWALATQCLPASVQAASIAQINGVALLGASGMSYAIGAIKDATGSSAVSFLPMVVVTLIGALAIFPLTRQKVSSPSPAKP